MHLFVAILLVGVFSLASFAEDLDQVLICRQLTGKDLRLKVLEVKKKVEALRIYKSQAHRPYGEEDFVLSLSKIRGIQVNAENAESFEIIRYIQR